MNQNDLTGTLFAGRYLLERKLDRGQRGHGVEAGRDPAEAGDRHPGVEVSHQQQGGGQQEPADDEFHGPASLAAAVGRHARTGGG